VVFSKEEKVVISSASRKGSWNEDVHRVSEQKLISVIFE